MFSGIGTAIGPTDLTRWDARYDGAVRNVSGHNSVCPYDSAAPNPRSLRDHHVLREPDIVADRHGLRYKRLRATVYVHKSKAVIVITNRHACADQYVLADLDGLRSAYAAISFHSGPISDPDAPWCCVIA